MTYDSAFPIQSTLCETAEPGMLLRDYFAAKAMQAYLTHAQAANRVADIVAGWSYEMADAMLKARSKK